MKQWSLLFWLTGALLLLTVAGGVASAASAPTPSGMATVGPGILTPFYPPSPSEQTIPVAAFRLDQAPVTNSDFLAFVKAHPQWQRDRISRLFADPRYLSHWHSATALGKDTGRQEPVTRVSWFAAKAYCQAQDKRLPTEVEWEFAASASETAPDSRADMTWRARVLDWYSRPTPAHLPETRQNPPNYWGVYDLHGLVWEWVLDFNSAMTTSDTREGGNANKTQFCGAGALAATEKDDYASFMRIALRSSLEAAFTMSTLGFRCADDLNERNLP